MAASIFDSPMFVKSFPTGEAARLFSDSAAVRAVLLVEGTLAKAQGELGLIPEDSAFFIHRSAMEVQIDPAGLAIDMKVAGFVPAVVAAFAKAMEAPEHSVFIHHEAAAEEIEAVALALRMRQFLTHCENRIGDLSDTQIDRKAALCAITQARTASVGLYMTSGLNVAKALADSLRLPLRETPVSFDEVATASSTICKAMKPAPTNAQRLSQLSKYCDGFTEMLCKDPQSMAALCLSQTCLCAAAALEIAQG